LLGTIARAAVLAAFTWIIAYLAGTRAGSVAQSEHVDAVVRAIRQEALAGEARAPTRRSEWQFSAGVALGLFGNAAISTIPALLGSSVATPILLVLVAVLTLAYADTVRRGEGVMVAVYEAGELTFAAISMFLSAVVIWQLITCADCVPGDTIRVTMIYTGFLVFLVVFRQFVVGPRPRPGFGTRRT